MKHRVYIYGSITLDAARPIESGSLVVYNNTTDEYSHDIPLDVHGNKAGYLLGEETKVNGLHKVFLPETTITILITLFDGVNKYKAQNTLMFLEHEDDLQLDFVLDKDNIVKGL